MLLLLRSPKFTELRESISLRDFGKKKNNLLDREGKLLAKILGKTRNALVEETNNHTIQNILKITEIFDTKGFKALEVRES